MMRVNLCQTVGLTGEQARRLRERLEELKTNIFTHGVRFYKGREVVTGYMYE